MVLFNQGNAIMMLHGSCVMLCCTTVVVKSGVNVDGNTTLEANRKYISKSLLHGPIWAL
jgi:hypothetical protein